jgi:beta-glucosidase
MRRRDFLQVAPAGLLVNDSSGPLAVGTEGILSTFPPGFVWGVSSSALQIEGALEADGRGPSIWDQTKGGEPARGPEPAAGHYHRWPDDIRLLQDLGVAAYRFSVAWPRVLPEGAGAVNQKGLDFYDQLVDGLLSAGITPWVCLHHWDLPTPLQKMGGWIQRETADRFLDYALVVVGRIGDRIRHWIPLNEPNVVAYGGYGAGVYPPGHMNEEFFFDSVHHQNLAQGLALKALAGRNRFIGPTLSISPVRPASSNPQDVAAAKLHDLIYHRAFLDPLLGYGYPEPLAFRMAPLVRPGDLEVIAQRPDFLGLNYYGPEYRQAWTGAPFSNDGNVSPPREPITSEKTPIDPQGLFEILCSVRDRYPRTPIVITENGFPGPDVVGADGRVDDAERIRFLRSHLLAAQKALAAGCDLRGYFVWSFLDCWEWTWGYDQRFGLVHVDFDTGVRIPKSSFSWYRSVLRSNKIQP